MPTANDDGYANDVHFVNDVASLMIHWQTLHHCDRREQHHICEANASYRNSDTSLKIPTSSDMILTNKLEFGEGVNVMQIFKNKYVFPVRERKIFTKAGLVMLPLELMVHIIFIIPSIAHRNLDGVWASLFFAIIFGTVHFQNLRLRKYCLAKWSFNGTMFTVYINDTSYTIDVNQPFCIATAALSFARRYSPVKYPFVMIWKPGARVPYEEIGGYQALKKCDTLIIPYDDETIALFQDHLNIKEIPKWPKSSVYYGISK